jgi:hypothetical protein
MDEGEYQNGGDQQRRNRGQQAFQDVGAQISKQPPLP